MSYSYRDYTRVPPPPVRGRSAGAGARRPSAARGTVVAPAARCAWGTSGGARWNCRCRWGARARRGQGASRAGGSCSRTRSRIHRRYWCPSEASGGARGRRRRRVAGGGASPSAGAGGSGSGACTRTVLCAPALLFLLVPASAARVYYMPTAGRVAGAQKEREHSPAYSVHEVELRTMVHNLGDDGVLPEIEDPCPPQSRTWGRGGRHSRHAWLTVPTSAYVSVSASTPAPSSENAPLTHCTHASHDGTVAFGRGSPSGSW